MYVFKSLLLKAKLHFFSQKFLIKSYTSCKGPFYPTSLLATNDEKLFLRFFCGKGIFIEISITFEITG